MAEPQSLIAVVICTYCRAPRSLGLLQDASCLHQEHVPGRRQRHPAVRPLEELNAQLLLELAHLLADG
jgi:hypothetical protein